MANSIKKYVWDATHSTNSQFLAPTALSGRESTDIKVKVGKAELTNSQYQLVTSGASRYAKFNQGFTPNVGDPIRIYRQTNHTGRLVDFVDGSLLTSETLDLDSNQLFNIAQEAYDKGDEATIGSESFYYSQGDAPENVAVGTLWYDTSSSTNILQVWSGTEWQATAPARITNKYGTTTAGGKTAVVSHPTNSSFSQFTDAAFTSDSSLYLNGVKLVETTSIYTIPTQGDYTVDNGTVTFLDLSSASDILVSETFSGHFSSSVFDAETNAAASADAAEASASTAGQWAGEAINNYSASNDEKLDAAKYASHPKGSTFSTHDNSATGQYSAKHYAETAADSATTASSAANNAQVQAVGTDLALGSNSKIKKVSDDIDDVTAVAGKITEVESLAGKTSEMTTLTTGTALSDINTVAGKATEVGQVAAIDSEIADVALKLSEIDAVEAKLSDIEDVAEVATQVSSVATAIPDITTVATEPYKSKIETVYTHRDTITDVGGEITKVTAVADDLNGANNIGTLANSTYKQQVTDVANQIGAVGTVSASINNNDISTVVSNVGDIGTVATDLTGSNNIGTVAGIPTQVETVAGIATEVVTVHGNNADISTVATNLNAGNSIANVSSSITNVDTVAGAISEVQTVAGVESEVKNLSASTGNMATLVSKLGQTNDLAGAVNDAEASATAAAGSASTATTQATAAAGSASTAATHAANLGSVAYQDLTAIAQEKAITATDVFVYDTSKDSDGGAWRNRTQGTSWYNEAFDSNRGSSKKFPAVAVITVSDTEMFIYDADDPSMPVWMRFGIGGSNASQTMLNRGDNGVNAVTALNGAIYLGCDLDNNASGGARVIDFIKDTCVSYSSGSSYHTSGTFNGNIRNRNSTLGFDRVGLGVIVLSKVNDIAVTVLPNAPIDPDTGLPVPTIAVATDGGVSVIKDDGSVVDLTVTNASQYNQSTFIEFFGEKIVFGMDAYPTGSRRTHIHDIPSSNKTFDVNGDTDDELFSTDSLANLNVPKQLGGTQEQVRAFANGNLATSKGLTVVDRPSNSAAYITSSYNTGWMNGDTKLATLMDTTAETISAPELVTNGDFSNGTTGWTLDGFTVSNGKLVKVAGTGNAKEAATSCSLIAGKTYVATFDYVDTGTNLQFSIGTATSLRTQNFSITEGTGAKSITFTPNTNMSYVGFIGHDSYVGEGGNISVRLAVPDRSVNDNGLNINGNIVKSAVATGAELMGYGFGTSPHNNLKVSYNSNHASLGSYWTFMTWVKRDTTAGWDFMLSLDGPNSTHGSGIRFDSDQSIAVCPVGGHADPTRAEINSTVAGNDLAWQMLAIVCDGQRAYFYRNGKLLETVNKAPSLSLPDSSYYFTVGAENEHSTGGPTDGRSKNMALLRLSASQATPEQIAKIYRDEKPLFQEGAKCTLSGKDDVQAIAYDEDTGKLHVGNGDATSGRYRDEFVGLQNVNPVFRDTYSIGTAISAVNGLVVEE